jgi:hypothetical protein
VTERRTDRMILRRARPGRASGTWNTHIGLCDSIYLRLDRDTWLSAS